MNNFITFTYIYCKPDTTKITDINQISTLPSNITILEILNINFNNITNIDSVNVSKLSNIQKIVLTNCNIDLNNFRKLISKINATNKRIQYEFNKCTGNLENIQQFIDNFVIVQSYSIQQISVNPSSSFITPSSIQIVKKEYTDEIYAATKAPIFHDSKLQSIVVPKRKNNLLSNMEDNNESIVANKLATLPTGNYIDFFKKAFPYIATTPLLNPEYVSAVDVVAAGIANALSSNIKLEEYNIDITNTDIDKYKQYLDVLISIARKLNNTNRAIFLNNPTLFSNFTENDQKALKNKKNVRPELQQITTEEYNVLTNCNISDFKDCSILKNIDSNKLEYLSLLSKEEFEIVNTLLFKENSNYIETINYILNFDNKLTNLAENVACAIKKLRLSILLSCTKEVNIEQLKVLTNENVQQNTDIYISILKNIQVDYVVNTADNVLEKRLFGCELFKQYIKSSLKSWLETDLKHPITNRLIILQGPPGTGKTTAITAVSAMVYVLFEAGIYNVRTGGLLPYSEQTQYIFSQYCESCGHTTSCPMITEQDAARYLFGFEASYKNSKEGDIAGGLLLSNIDIRKLEYNNNTFLPFKAYGFEEVEKGPISVLDAIVAATGSDTATIKDNYLSYPFHFMRLAIFPIMTTNNFEILNSKKPSLISRSETFVMGAITNWYQFVRSKFKELLQKNRIELNKIRFDKEGLEYLTNVITKSLDTGADARIITSRIESVFNVVYKRYKKTNQAIILNINLISELIKDLNFAPVKTTSEFHIISPGELSLPVPSSDSIYRPSQVYITNIATSNRTGNGPADLQVRVKTLGKEDHMDYNRYVITKITDIFSSIDGLFNKTSFLSGTNAIISSMRQLIMNKFGTRGVISISIKDLYTVYLEHLDTLIPGFVIGTLSLYSNRKIKNNSIWFFGVTPHSKIERLDGKKVDYKSYLSAWCVILKDRGISNDILLIIPDTLPQDDLNKCLAEIRNNLNNHNCKLTVIKASNIWEAAEAVLEPAVDAF